MKKYFDFQLAPTKLLPYWIAVYVIFILPIFGIINLIHSYNDGSNRATAILIYFLSLLIFIFLFLIISFYMFKMIIPAIELNSEKVKSDFSLGTYLTNVVIPGVLLSVITAGIYIPWFSRNIYRYFINNSSYKDKNFSFMGKGGKLFVIILVGVMLPIVIFISLKMIIFGIHHANSHRLISQMIMYFILIPGSYLIYKWRVNVQYENHHFTWYTKFFPSVGKMFVQIFLGIITFSIYMPAACLKLYKYFLGKTKSNIVDNQQYCFDFDTNHKEDFLMIWGYIALTIITLGIYYPWAFCNITQRILSRTSIEKRTVNAA